ncbi:hypothetical protein H0A43_07335 [Arcobacter lanthieri]|uniref:hypothetical protein n=1 Tax=Aliarcobacter lanthieri TaxID=1355374 RepID=UPI001921C334|nr:hypothetical protein [Aliarcobacter lanthieri]MBL3520284.1 hypothetical protein [Aliarcobacter lanthieri]
MSIYNNEAFDYDKNLDKPLKNIVSLNFYNIVISKNSSFAHNFLPRCCIGLELIQLPKFIYEIVENNIIAYDENTGFISAFKLKKGSKGGFANRPITLPIKGGKVFSKLGISKITFLGDIWDDITSYNFAKEYYGIKETIPIGYKKRFAKLDIYTGAQLNKEIIETKMKIIGIGAI